MKRRSGLTIAVLMMVGCQATPPNPAETSNWQREKWQTGCQDDQVNAYGEETSRAKCWAMVSDFSTSDLGMSIGVATIFEIDHNGPRMTENRALDTEICDEVPTKIAVDGRRIDQLSMPQRIEAVINGQRLVRQKDRPWPYCNVYNETTTLSGARNAYDEMVRLWELRNSSS
ncbi:hypothetical protein [Georhizobium profundi]|nr:hypothetical protein [Georhizobium profundi]